MRIALFEDNELHAKRLEETVAAWAKHSGKTAAISHFSSALEANELALFDCLLLDVEMPGMDGIELAREIRRCGSKVPIVFVSSHTEYSIDGYEVNALRFIDKNAVDFERRVFECMEKTSYEIENSLNACYTIRASRKLVSIPLHEIAYFEVLDHDLVIHTAAGTFSERKTISKIKRELPKQFVQIGRSHIINVLQAVQITASSVELRCGKRLTVSPKYSAALFDAFLEMRQRLF